MTGPADGGPQDAEGPRRYLIAAAVSRYPKCPDWDRPGLTEARKQIVELFTQKLGYRHHTALGADPTVQQLREQLRAFCTSDERREDDLVAVYLSGHGEVDEAGSEHVLLMADTDPADVSFTSLPTAELVRVFSGTRVRRLLLILDTCYSGRGGNELAGAALERLGTSWAQGAASPGLVIVSSAQPHQQAQAGLFPHLLSRVVDSQATAGHAPKHLSVSAVVQQMNGHDDKPAYQHISLSLLGLTGEPPDFLTNPRHSVRLTDVDLALQDAADFDAEARRRETEFTSRLLVRAMGSYYGKYARGWWFYGRHQVLTELATWLGSESSDRNSAQGDLFEAPLPPGAGPGEVVRVVTAGPGSGKTAVLGLLAALTMPERRRTVPVDAIGLKPGMTPAERSIDVVMYAQNLTNAQVLSGLAAAAGFKCATVSEFLERLEQRHSGRERPFTVLLDALDEATTPDTLCSQIVRPLIEHSKGRIRLLLGTRPYLLDCLGIRTDDQRRVLNLDSDRYADHQALRAYTIRNLIESHSTSPYRQADPRILRHVASAVAAAAGSSFLVARFAAYTLAAADEVVSDPGDPQWRASLPRHADEAMRDDLTRRLGPDAQRAADLLRPLAYAEGQGLPWEGIWPPLASAISGRTYTDDDLLWLRRNAGSYVVEATENGRSAYRLYHQALTEHLRENTDPAAVHSAFVDILTTCVPYGGDATRDWSRAHPYTLNYLATHAAAADRVDSILKDTEYLVHATPYNLTPHLQRASSDEARLTAAVYRTALHLHALASPAVRRQALALNAARAGATRLLRQLTRHAGPGEWIPDWATGSDFTPALRESLAGDGDTGWAVGCGVLDGKPVAVTGSVDGTARVWDLASGRPIGEPLTGHRGAVVAVACTVLDGKPVAVTGSVDGTARVWDLASGQPIGNPLTGHHRRVEAVACTMLDGKPVAVTANEDRTVCIWDLASGRPIGEPLTGHRGAVDAVACTVLDGRPVAVTANEDWTACVWDLASGQPIGNPLTGHHGPVRAVACTVLDGKPVAITGSTDGTARVWDLASGQPIGNPLTGHHGPVRAVACTVLDGRPVAVTGSVDGTARVWDLASGRPIGNPLTGHGREVVAVACAVLDGRPVAVTGSRDGTTRVWDLAHSVPVTQRMAGHSYSVAAVACTVLDGKPVAITGSADRTARVWDLASGRPIGNPLTGHDRPVAAVACTVLDGKPVAITGSADRTARVWDLASGRPIGNPLTGHDRPVAAVACTILDGRPVAVTGGGDGTARVWDLASGRPIGNPLTGHDRPVAAVACTILDGRPVAVTGSADGTARVWDLASGRPIGNPLTGHDRPVAAVACTNRSETPSPDTTAGLKRWRARSSTAGR
ncbi:caspase family protein [Streptomyces sp. NBC_00365]|uniref:caspase family protein n=1 Tax=Streptomyces sp. NBC_00365 TaxID=2975726 RepID=UPI0022592B7C|nr:caspase family protein [Streptomyces sp. NBC_00365]MCX5097821.1 caspase family protein [Streptomyces sp. NBC_00365]